MSESMIVPAHDLKAGERARVAAAIAPLQREAKASAPQTSQVAAGHVVRLIEKLGDWWRLAGVDDYEGWMHRGYLEAASGNEHTLRLSLGATVHLANGLTRALPLGARVPDNARVIVGEAITAEEQCTRFPTEQRAIALSALRYFSGASYQWGGVTPWGCDCSGLVQSVFALHGHALPRDAWQQAEIGTPLFADALLDNVNALLPADLLFFSDREDRHVTHVGIVIDATHMVHSALGRGGVNTELLSSDDTYLERLRANFVGAQRVVR